MRWLILFSVYWITYSASAQYRINVNITNCKDSLVVLAYNYFDSNKVQIKDSISLVNGKGSTVYEGQNFGGIYFIYFPSNKESFRLKINPGDVYDVTVDAQNINNSAHATDTEQEAFFNYKRLEQSFAYLSEDYKLQKEAGKKFTKKERIQFFKIKTDALAVYRAEQLASMQKISALWHHFNALQILGKTASADGSLIPRATYLDQFDLGNPQLLLSPNLKKIVDSYLFMFPMYADSLKSPMDEILSRLGCDNLTYKFTVNYFLKVAEKGKILNAPVLYTYIADQYVVNSDCKAIKPKVKKQTALLKDYMNAVKLNEVCPDIVLADGSSSLHDFASDYDYTFLIFYSVTCPHCKKEMPKINKALNRAEKVLDKKVGRYAVNLQYSDSSSWRTFIEEHSLTNHYKHVMLPRENTAKQTYAAYSTPMVFVIDKRGKMLARRLRYGTYTQFFTFY